MEISARDWFEERFFQHGDFAELAEPRPAGRRPPATASLVLPTRNVAETIGPILHAVATEEGLRLDAHYEELVERPPMGEVLAADRDRDTVA